MKIIGGVIRITDYVDTDGTVHDLHVQKATVVGPAVLVPRGRVTVKGGNFDAGGHGLEGIVWEIDPVRTATVGGITVTESSFVDCSFVGIGIAGSSSFITHFLSGMNTNG